MPEISPSGPGIALNWWTLAWAITGVVSGIGVLYFAISKLCAAVNMSQPWLADVEARKHEDRVFGKTEVNYATHIAEATARYLASHGGGLVMGAGVTDIKHCYGTTALAHEQFPDRVLETPLSETMLTGACVGLAENGYEPIFVHQRMDFGTLSVEGLVNTAAKHRFLYGQDVPMMVRLVIGQGWGAGVSHTQNFAPS